MLHVERDLARRVSGSRKHLEQGWSPVRDINFMVADEYDLIGESAGVMKQIRQPVSAAWNEDRFTR